jgi:hypothetical protein|tara:strand:- start:49168 stop:49551 length:384 start_codon:yes stop_codon:yes gene_type:complete
MYHKINSEKQSGDSNTIVDVFTIFGKHSSSDDDGYPRLPSEEQDHHNAYAKRVSVGNRIKYYVKRGRYGRLYNPIGLYSEGTAKKQLRHAGRPEWQFKEATEQVFDKYIKFLKTKNVAWLNNAERDS